MYAANSIVIGITKDNKTGAIVTNNKIVESKKTKKSTLHFCRVPKQKHVQ